MSRIHMSITPRDAHDGDPVEIEALDVPTALTIADINTRSGTAELWDGKRRLGRLTKHGGSHATFWEVEPEHQD